MRYIHLFRGIFDTPYIQINCKKKKLEQFTKNSFVLTKNIIVKSNCPHKINQFKKNLNLILKIYRFYRIAPDEGTTNTKETEQPNLLIFDKIEVDDDSNSDSNSLISETVMKIKANNIYVKYNNISSYITKRSRCCCFKNLYF